MGLLKPKAEQTPRLMSEAETAHHLHMSVSEFSRRAAELERDLGMPRRHPILRKRDRIAIDQWLNAIFGVEQKGATLSALVRSRMGALKDGDRAD